jgi:hypothetical protein
MFGVVFHPTHLEGALCEAHEVEAGVGVFGAKLSGVCDAYFLPVEIDLVVLDARGMAHDPVIASEVFDSRYDGGEDEVSRSDLRDEGHIRKSPFQDQYVLRFSERVGNKFLLNILDHFELLVI